MWHGTGFNVSMKIKSQSNVTNQLAAVMSVGMLFWTLASAMAGDSDQANQGRLSNADYKFAKAAAAGGAFEINLGNIAATKATNSSVRQFAQLMVTEHGKAGQDLQQVAAQAGATLPTSPSGDQQKIIDHLNGLSGAKFDREYVAAMVKAHEEDEKAFKKASEKSDNADLKDFAGRTLLMVQAHLKHAQDLEAALKHNLASN
jgi:putative membrane protein